MNSVKNSNVIIDDIPYLLNPILIDNSDVQIRASIQNGISYVSIIDLFSYLKISKKIKSKFIKKNECLWICPPGPYPRSQKFLPLKSIIDVIKKIKTNDINENFLRRIEKCDNNFQFVIQYVYPIQNKKIKVETEIKIKKESDEEYILSEGDEEFEKRRKYEIKNNLIQFISELDRYNRNEKFAVSEFISMIRDHNLDFDRLSKILNGSIL
jgi:hypothetical protein